MRIISGKFKGRKINRPEGIRPTQDKVREALFDILGNIKGLSFLELYAGSGAVGLEALSQGASKVVFVENNRACVRKIEDNLAALGLRASELACYRVITMDAGRAIERLDQRKEKFDIIFLDPPYCKGIVPRSRKNIESRSGLREGIGDSLAKKALKTLSGYDILTSYSLIICQHFKKDIFPEVIDNLKLVKQARYGDTVLSFYKKVASKN